eukprot:1633827-Heterocapsa_arctica.AAC.1
MSLPSHLALAPGGSLLRQSALPRVGWPYAEIFLCPCPGLPWADYPLFPFSDDLSDVRPELRPPLLPPPLLLLLSPPL